MGERFLTIKEMASLLKIPLRTAKRLPKKYPLITRPAPRTSRNGKRPTLVLMDSLYDLPAKYLSKAELPPKPASAVEQNITDSAWLYLSNEERDAVMEKVEIMQPLLFADATDKTALAEKIAAENGVTVRTVFRWVSAWKSRDYKALCRKDRKDKGKLRAVSPEVQSTLKKLYLNKTRPTVREVFDAVKPLAEQRGERLSYATACRVIESIPPAAAAYYRETKKTFTDKFEVKIKRERPDSINEIWCGDHHRLDIFILNRYGKPERPWITIWQDLCDMSITGYTLSFQGNSLTIMQSFINGVAQKPEKDYPMFGVPARVYIDNGKDYTSRDFEALLNDLGVEKTHALPYRGSSKPVERFFRTFEQQCISKLPGYCGRNPQNKPDNVKALLTLDRLEPIIRGYIKDRYHRELRRPLGKSCIERHADFAHVPKMTAPREVLEVVATSRIPRKVTTQGVQLDNILYQHDALIPLVGEKIEVRPVYKNKGEVMCFFKGEYICHASDRELMSYSITEEEFKAIAKEKKKQKQGIKEYMALLEEGALIENVKDEAIRRKAAPVQVPDYKAIQMSMSKERKAVKGKREEEKVVALKPGKKLYMSRADKEAEEQKAALSGKL